jgi:uncharacterized 2Fe-2S/4Fe-4S cluster protein (DUF4445 family)
MSSGDILTVLPEGRTLEAEEGENLLDVLLKAGIQVHSACGNEGTCGKCLVRIEGEVSSITESEQSHISENDLALGVRHACQVQLRGGARVEILHDLHNPGSSVELRESEDGGNGFRLPHHAKLAAAVDIGTTTIKMELVSLSDGRTVARQSSLNPQRAFGHDVMSRIHAAKDPADFLIMVRMARESVRTMIERAAAKLHASLQNVSGIVVSGNTVMLHLFFGMDITGMGKYPYVPVTLEATSARASEIGLPNYPDATVTRLPAISAYLGGDLVAGLLASGICEEDKTSILIDIGTNSEIILAHSGGITATSCAAGPALEGMNIRCGMTAIPGAIESVRIGDDVTFEVVPENTRPLGLCGSGVIELVAELLRAGIVDTKGKMAQGNGWKSGQVRERIRDRGGAMAFHLTEDVFLTQKDVRQVQLAKGAILSGLAALLETSGVSVGEVERVYIAGEFGRRLKLENLLRLGILERFSNASYELIGNSSLRGARMIALDPSLLEKARELAKRVNAFPLSSFETYESLFIKSLEFPSQSASRTEIRSNA